MLIKFLNILYLISIFKMLIRFHYRCSRQWHVLPHLRVLQGRHRPPYRHGRWFRFARHDLRRRIGRHCQLVHCHAGRCAEESIANGTGGQVQRHSGCVQGADAAGGTKRTVQGRNAGDVACLPSECGLLHWVRDRDEGAKFCGPQFVNN